MNSGMYAALTGNLSAQRRLEVISNNLANANSTGFKADQIQFESVLANVKNSTPAPVFSNERYSTDFSPGAMQRTDNQFDVALDGDGFFVVNTPQGPAYTRQGNFRRGQAGTLVTADGYEVQGTGGAINLPAGRVEVGVSGQVTVNGNQVGTLSVVDFPKPYTNLAKTGSGLFVTVTPQAPTASPATQVKQGYLESSNVKVVVEMARMIEASRYFEICTKAVRTYDEMNSRAANDLGKV